MSLNEKVAIVTGISRGIGVAVARVLTEAGARVFGVARTQPPQNVLPQGVRCFTTDVRNSKNVTETIRSVLEEAGTIDILINNAGLEYFKPLIETTDDEYDLTLDTNLRGSFLFSRAVLPTFLAHRTGQILFINSLSGLRGFAEDSVYCASKHGLSGFADALEEELRPHGVRVTSIYPGATDTDLSAASWAPKGDPRRSFFLTPEDIAHAVIYVLDQPKRVAISRLVLRPFIELPYSDFLSTNLVADLMRESQGPPAE
ncbi:MAG: SDR family oxidoreductase [Anaerolineales bacterium]|nr:SDR family oxidoreductase [Anaerolineales bacterium]